MEPCSHWSHLKRHCSDPRAPSIRMGYQVQLCSSSYENLHLLWEPTGSKLNWRDTTFRKVAKSLRRIPTLKAGVSPHATLLVSSVNHIKTLNFPQPLGCLEHLPLSLLLWGFTFNPESFPMAYIKSLSSSLWPLRVRCPWKGYWDASLHCLSYWFLDAVRWRWVYGSSA